ncbi:VOC family protein [Streptomyces sp. BE20]|uniref:VOC family protein n=1 Tax=Streptomyces sp. BE20 TaxID=3002525 RepID=UPI002E75D624|nr:VOC family protein [Streptomyces sp. BE20]MEE1828085.1 VOC family protein [Streptomyces sp. BE20]
MAVQLNHTIVPARDDKESARFLADILGLADPVYSEPFQIVRLSNDVALDVMRVDGPITTGHYAFLVDDTEFDEILDRVRARGLTFWADPFHRHADRTNDWYGGRGAYFEDPSGHNLEIMTRASDVGR